MSSAALEKSYFEGLNRRILASRRAGEHFFVNLSGEQSQFVRLNSARVRQIGTVEDAELEIALVLEGAPGELRTASSSITLTGLSYTDHERIDGALAGLRHEVPELPVDPYAQLPEDHGSSETIRKGSIPSAADATSELLAPLEGVDIAGIFAAGTIMRAMANSAGLVHWFSTQNFSFDYSLYTASQRALKGTFADASWDAGRYRAEIEHSRQKLALLERPARKVERGTYRTYLEPAAFSELIAILSWGPLSEAAIRQGDSPLRLMRETSGKKLSPLFSLGEDFSEGMVPRINEEGELAPEKLAIIDRGQLTNTLVSTRTALEYGAQANGAEGHEAPRAPGVAGGGMARADALKKLGTGLHLSNLHYLNWSDQPGGRITGMTRYACFWVENGEIVAPIENLRFDDSIFTLLGSELEELSRETAFQPNVGTYDGRDLGGMRCPGALLRKMAFTL